MQLCQDKVRLGPYLTFSKFFGVGDFSFMRLKGQSDEIFYVGFFTGQLLLVH